MSRKGNTKKVAQAFDLAALQRICAMPEEMFGEAYDLKCVEVAQSAPNDFYFYRDNGSSVLAVAHLDTVAKAGARECHYLETAGGPVIYSRALDDRLGAYTILELLPKLGITYDILLTVGEETGQSTADFFEPEKAYDWVIEFDRGGTDVVMYQFEDDDLCDLVKDSGARVGEGIFSDICYLEHLGVKALNWGIGYRDYHTARSHAYLDDTFAMVGRYLRFHNANVGIAMPHVKRARRNWWENEPDLRECVICGCWYVEGTADLCANCKDKPFVIVSESA